MFLLRWKEALRSGGSITGPGSSLANCCPCIAEGTGHSLPGKAKVPGAKATAGQEARGSPAPHPAKLGGRQVLMEIEAKEAGDDLAGSNPPGEEREEPAVKERSENRAECPQCPRDLLHSGLDVLPAGIS